ncbi:MAG: DUF47 family protein [Bacillota bacterium]|nr:DUF47 family protein [Bacillota bacterium]
MFNISPKNDKFFELFINYSGIIHKSTEMLKELIVNPTGAEAKFNAIKEVEREGDEMLHSIFKELDNSFITPFDREDIVIIGKAMDDILDLVETTASRFVIFNLKSSKTDAIEIAKLTVDNSNKITDLVKEFKGMKKSKLLCERVVEINDIENQGDSAFRKAVKELFDGSHDTVEIITWKEIFECLEAVINATENLANIIEGIVMKNA